MMSQRCIVTSLQLGDPFPLASKLPERATTIKQSRGGEILVDSGTRLSLHAAVVETGTMLKTEE
jgi:hypothetical protein